MRSCGVPWARAGGRGSSSSTRRSSPDDFSKPSAPPRASALHLFLQRHEPDIGFVHLLHPAGSLAIGPEWIGPLGDDGSVHRERELARLPRDHVGDIERATILNDDRAAVGQPARAGPWIA